MLETLCSAIHDTGQRDPESTEEGTQRLAFDTGFSPEPDHCLVMSLLLVVGANFRSTG
jgi:hypothetical protein